MPQDIAPPLEGPGPYQLRRARAEQGLDQGEVPASTPLPVGRIDVAPERTPGVVTFTRDGEDVVSFPNGDPSSAAAGEAADARRSLSSLKLRELHNLIPPDSEIPKTLKKPDLIARLRAIGITEG